LNKGIVEPSNIAYRDLVNSIFRAVNSNLGATATM